MGPQEFRVFHFHRMTTAYLADNPGHRIGMPTAVESGSRIVDIDTVERGANRFE